MNDQFERLFNKEGRSSVRKRPSPNQMRFLSSTDAPSLSRDSSRSLAGSGGKRSSTCSISYNHCYVQPSSDLLGLPPSAPLQQLPLLSWNDAPPPLVGYDPSALTAYGPSNHIMFEESLDVSAPEIGQPNAYEGKRLVNEGMADNVGGGFLVYHALPEQPGAGVLPSAQTVQRGGQGYQTLERDCKSLDDSLRPFEGVSHFQSESEAAPFFQEFQDSRAQPATTFAPHSFDFDVPRAYAPPTWFGDMSLPFSNGSSH